MKVLIDTNVIIDWLARREPNKYKGHDTAIHDIRLILSVFEIADTTEAILLRALESKSRDFEDAVQSETARKVSAEYIITRNVKDFLLSPIPAVTPQDFKEYIV